MPDWWTGFYPTAMDLGCCDFQYASRNRFGDCDSDFGGEAELVFASDSVREMVGYDGNVVNLILLCHFKTALFYYAPLELSRGY